MPKKSADKCYSAHEELCPCTDDTKTSDKIKNNDASALPEKATIYDIARVTGTTISAVSRAFNPTGKISEEKRRIILEASKKYGYYPNRVAGSLARKPIKIGFLGVANIPAYYNEIVSGIKYASGRLADFRVSCDIRQIDPEDASKENYLYHLDKFAETGCDAVLLSLVDYTPAVVQKIRELSLKGIYAATITSDNTDCGRIFSSQNDLDVAARMAAQFLSLVIGHGAECRRRVLLFSGAANTFIHGRLISVFKEEAALNGLELLEVFDTRDVPETAKESAESALAKYCSQGELAFDGIYISSANSIPIIDTLCGHGLGDKVKIVASDIFSELNRYILDGTVEATIYQNPFEQARLAFDTMYYYLTGQILKNTLYKVKPQIVMKSNLQLYI